MSSRKSRQPVAYVISAVEEFGDQSALTRYGELAGPAIEHHGGRFIVSNTEPVVVEGKSQSRHVSMVEFPSMEQAKTWYDSPDNAEARAITPAAFKGRVLMFAEGVKPQNQGMIVKAPEFENIRVEIEIDAAPEEVYDTWLSSKLTAGFWKCPSRSLAKSVDLLT
jgi:uncharacterized protein (DUF1330 family)